jgi:ATP-dependent RNA helicase DeaD
MALTKSKRSFGSAEVWSLFRDAGYLKPTHLQSRLVPLILRGKDVALEAERDSGKTAAFILPLLLKVRKGKAGIKAVVLTPTTEDTRKVEREFRRFADFDRKTAVAALGTETADKREHRLLAQEPEVVVGTPARVIDHIRRGNLRLTGIQIAVIDRTETPEKPGFEEDVLFIFSKLPHRKQTILMTSSQEAGSGSLLGLLRRPVMLPASSWRQQASPGREYYAPVSSAQRLDALLALVLAEPVESLLIQCPDTPCVREVLQRVHALRLSALALQEDMNKDQQDKVCQTFSVGKVPILVSTFQAASRRSLRWVTHVINLGVPPNVEAYAPRSFVLLEVLTLVADETVRRKESILANTEKKELPSEAEVLRGTIQHILRRIRDEEDPQALNHYRSVVRRNVPLALRSYFTAYLFKESFVPERPKAAEFTKLFINVGRNRRLFPRDLIDLVMGRLKASRSQIRGIKILDNYSFIEIDSALAERAIRELSGVQLKGRVVSVNHARKREEK